jgi:hypothetical protein
MEIADADERAEWTYRTCCEILEIQGRTKCRAFFRAIFDWGLQPMFATREGCFRSSLELHQKRTRAQIPQNLSAIGGHMKREMGKLRAKWNTKLEIATRDTENQQRLARERELEPKTQSIQEAVLRSVALKQFANSNDGQQLAKFVSDADSWLSAVSLGAKNARQTIEVCWPQAAPSQAVSPTNSTSKLKATRKVKPPSSSEMKRRAVILGAIQSGLEGRKYCALLDNRKLRPPERWRDEGCPDTYTAAYGVKGWAKRIQDEKSRYGKKYRETPVREREAIIQGESGTRQTRR